MTRISLHILETPEEMTEVENLQRLVWPGDDIEVIPVHLLVTAVHNGGLVIGAYDLPGQPGVAAGGGTSADEGATDDDPGAENPGERLPDLSILNRPLDATEPSASKGVLVGFTFGFPGLYHTPDGPRPKHCSHMLGVHPNYRDQGIGFLLKRAQWQMVRHQGLDRITWTYDPLLSRNAYLNITRLGGVCNTYLRNTYGDLRDELNTGLPTDRFQVDWWINSQRVQRRLGKRARRPLDLAHFLAAGTGILNASSLGAGGLPRPPENYVLGEIENVHSIQEEQPLLLVEIPANFMAIRASDPALALEWRLHTRDLFEQLFQRGYLITDFVYLPGNPDGRSFYVLSHGEAVISGVTKDR